MVIGSEPVSAFQARQASTKVITWPLSSAAPRALMALRPSGSVMRRGSKGGRLPQVQRIDRLHVVMPVEEHVKLLVATGMAEHHRMPARLAQGRLDADALQLVDQPLPGVAAMILIGGIGGDGGNCQPLEQPFEGRIEIGIDPLQDLVELGHGEYLPCGRGRPKTYSHLPGDRKYEVSTRV